MVIKIVIVAEIEIQKRYIPTNSSEIVRVIIGSIKNGIN
tara:strand:+ start:3715 stop:3831 length:117 start_codon:yes stop_codon:yes gene_type:complete